MNVFDAQKMNCLTEQNKRDQRTMAKIVEEKIRVK